MDGVRRTRCVDPRSGSLPSEGYGPSRKTAASPGAAAPSRGWIVGQGSRIAQALRFAHRGYRPGSRAARVVPTAVDGRGAGAYRQLVRVSRTLVRMRTFVHPVESLLASSALPAAA